MTPLVGISITVYAALVLGAALGYGSITVNHTEVTNPFLRFMIALFGIPIAGYILWIAGFVVMVVGKFLLLPIAALTGSVPLLHL